MQLVLLAAKLSAGHAPELPVHISATSHCPAEARQVVVAGSTTSTQLSLVPLQWSAASSSHAPPCEAPVQRVLLDLKLSAGHAPELPVHISATSHCPIEARQVVVAGLKTSTHVLLVPLQ